MVGGPADPLMGPNPPGYPRSAADPYSTHGPTSARLPAVRGGSVLDPWAQIRPATRGPQRIRTRPVGPNPPGYPRSAADPYSTDGPKSARLPAVRGGSVLDRWAQIRPATRGPRRIRTRPV